MASMTNDGSATLQMNMDDIDYLNEITKESLVQKWENPNIVLDAKSGSCLSAQEKTEILKRQNECKDTIYTFTNRRDSLTYNKKEIDEFWQSGDECRKYIVLAKGKNKHIHFDGKKGYIRSDYRESYKSVSVTFQLSDSVTSGFPLLMCIKRSQQTNNSTKKRKIDHSSNSSGSGIGGGGGNSFNHNNNHGEQKTVFQNVQVNNLSVKEDLIVDGTITNHQTHSIGLDHAEWFPFKDEKPKLGDIVKLRREGNNSFISLDTSGKNGTICIVSGVNQAGFIGGEKSENKILIALVGQVIVNIDDDDDSLKNFDDNCSLSIIPSGNNDGRAKVIQGFFCGTVQKINKEQNQVTILIAPYAREIRKLTRDIDLLKENNSHINALEQQVTFLIEEIVALKNEKTIHQVQQATKLQPRKTENQSETKENFTCTELGTESKIIETEGAVELRRYQQRIVEQSRNENIIVRLPTGAGKTLVAAEMIRENFQGEFQNLKDKKALMFVPVIVLIKQQANEVERWLKKHGVSARVNQFRGGSAFPMEFDVLICTPKAFENAQAKQYENELAWENFSLVIFDEVHHVLKGHPYRKLTTALRNARARTGTNQSNFPRIVGLTASLTYEVDISKIKKSIQILCDELNVTQICQASYQELKDDGYKGTHAKAEVDLVIENELVPKDRGLVPISSREPHLMKQIFESRIRKGTATKYALELWSVINSLEKYAISIDQSCFDSSKPPRISQPLALWETFTHKLATHKIKSSPPLSGVLFELSLWYGALKLLIVSWEEKEYLATSFLQMHNIRQSTMQYTPELTCQIQSFCESFPDTYLRYENLKRILCTEFQKFELEDKKFRGIIFVDQRISTHILKHVLRMDDVTSVLFQPQVVYAAGTPASPRFSLTKSQLASALDKFKTGESNLLIATNVAEEGVDVPAANCVVRFDSMVNSVSLTQSRGRARQANSSFIVMDERSDRTTRDLEVAEETQMQVCENYKCVPKTAEDEAEILELDRLLQRKKEEDSLIKINNRIVNDGDISEANSLALLDIICKETKVDLLDSIGGKPSSVTLTYDSILRKCQTTINIIGNVSKKSQKVAKRKAAKELLEILFSEFSQGL